MTAAPIASAPREALLPLDTGLRYHTLSWGDEDSDHVIVLLHGFLDLGWCWEDIAPRLAERALVIAPDLRGHGDSDRVGAGGYYHFLDYLADLASLVEQRCRPPRRLSLVGHSMGGSVAAYFSGSFPGRVHRLALLEGTGPADDSTEIPERVPHWIVGWRRAVHPAHPPRAYEDLAAAAAQLRRHDPLLSAEGALRLAGHGTHRGEDGRYRFKHDPLHLTSGPLPFRRDNALSFFRRVRCPVLLVEGAESFLRLPPEEAAVRHGAFADRRYHLLPGAGHMIQRHQPAALAQLLYDFLFAGEADS